MKYLLDTHAFLWLDAEPSRLSTQVSAICSDDANVLLLSLASVWEMQIKFQLGKLTLNSPLRDVLSANQMVNRIELLPITLDHILALGKLPDYHKDPFDRMLIAQCMAEKIVLLSHDPEIQKYPVQHLW